MKIEEKVDKKIKEGWIRAWMMIEALAINQEASKSALEKHIHKMEKEEGVIVYKSKFHPVTKVEKPLPNVSVGFSCIVEIELVAKNLDRLVYIVMNYGPSTIEILEPEKISLDAGEAQGILNSIAEMLHRFAAAGLGGVLVEA